MMTPSVADVSASDAACTASLTAVRGCLAAGLLRPSLTAVAAAGADVCDPVVADNPLTPSPRATIRGQVQARVANLGVVTYRTLCRALGLRHDCSLRVKPDDCARILEYLEGCVHCLR